jgi:hypothetical protein
MNDIEQQLEGVLTMGKKYVARFIINEVYMFKN